MIDILIKRSFAKKEFFLLIDRVLDLEDKKRNNASRKKG